MFQTCGGIVVMCNENLFDLVVCLVGQFSVLCLFGGAENGEEQVFTVVYGPGEGSAGSSFGD